MGGQVADGSTRTNFGSILIKIKRDAECALNGHKLTLSDEKALFAVEKRTIETDCSNCNSKVVAQVRSDSPSQYLIKAL